MTEHSARDAQLLDNFGERIRTATHRVADELREMAERLDRIADHNDLHAIPSEAIHLVNFGIANSGLTAILNAHRGYIEMERAIALYPTADGDDA